MAGIFDFVPNSHVAEEIPPEEAAAVSMNGWEFTSRPAVPYRRKFRLTIGGMRWILKPRVGYPLLVELDLLTTPEINAGRLLEFYKANRTFDSFTYPHEFLGDLTCRFAEPVRIPKALPNSSGLVPEFELVITHHNPSFT